MDNIDRIKEYIQDAVISPLERLMNENSGEPEANLYEKYYMQGGYPPRIPGTGDRLAADEGVTKRDTPRDHTY